MRLGIHILICSLFIYGEGWTKTMHWKTYWKCLGNKCSSKTVVSNSGNSRNGQNFNSVQTFDHGETTKGDLSLTNFRLTGVGRAMMNDLGSFGKFENSAKDSLMESCLYNDCQTQSTQDIVCRDTLMRLSNQFENKFFNRDNMNGIQRQFSRIYDYKKEIVKNMGLSNYISPVDNGLVDGDVLLTEDQAIYLINELKKQQSGRKKRNAIFFDDNNNFLRKWDTRRPIPYMFADDYDERQKNMVRQALSMITTAASCIRFEYNPRANYLGHFIYYMNTVNNTLCGISRIGRLERGNFVQINFKDCTDNVGVIIHETLHSLGVAHTHQRQDREKHIEIFWRKINPQMISDFMVVDQKIYSTYGVPYDFDSIMHYKYNMGARLNPFQETMRPLQSYAINKRKMGQRTHLSGADTELLNKLYCTNSCNDRYANCGAWAVMGLCTDRRYRKFMTTRCKKACGYCGGTRHY